MSEHYRSRMSKYIQREVSQILLYDMKDPAFAGVTITDVEVAREMDMAKIYVQIHGDDEETTTVLNKLKNARKKIRHLLASRLPTRVLPKLHFYYDDSLERGARIEELFKQIKQDSNEQDS